MEASTNKDSERVAAPKKKYVVAYSFKKIVGSHGRRRSAMAYEDAKALCDEANAQFPNIHHWPEAVVDDEER